MRMQMDSAEAAGAPPDFREMAMLRMTADSTRDAEITARAVLTSDAQRNKFDQNLVEIRGAKPNAKRRCASVAASRRAGRDGRRDGSAVGRTRSGDDVARR